MVKQTYVERERVCKRERERERGGGSQEQQVEGRAAAVGARSEKRWGYGEGESECYEVWCAGKSSEYFCHLLHSDGEVLEGRG